MGEKWWSLNRTLATGYPGPREPSPLRALPLPDPYTFIWMFWTLQWLANGPNPLPTVFDCF